MNALRLLNNRWLLVMSLLLVVYNEVGIYFVSYMNWPPLHDHTNSDSLRLLLVADPQLIGEQDEPASYGWLARWDADRYLHNTYMLAKHYFKADRIIFLGDLFDEGLKADDETYARYLHRFKRVFQLNDDHDKNKKYIYLSGDNDVGGEYYGDRTQKLGDRFEHYFETNLMDMLDLNDFVRVAKLDLDYTVSFYNSIKRNYLNEIMSELDKKQTTTKRDRFMIILNHMSLLKKNKRELRALVDDLNSALVIKGDSHKFYIAKYNNQAQRVESMFSFMENPSNFYIMQLKPHNTAARMQYFYELSIPTCSYRMGVPQMAYGMLTINSNGKAYVSLLWLPSRYDALYNYFYFVLAILLYLAYMLFMQKFFIRLYRNFYRIMYKHDV